MTKWLGLLISIMLLITLSAVAEEDYAMVISEDDGYIPEYCQDCYANIVTQTDNQVVENVHIGMSDALLEEGMNLVGVGDEGLSAAIITASFARADQEMGGAYIIENISLKNLPGNGIMITNTQTPIILKDITVESQGVKDQSSSPVGIAMKNAMNVSIENCSALGGALFRISNSKNIQIRNDTARNFFFEGIENSTIDDCTADCIMIKGMISPFYFKNFLGSINETMNATLNSMPEKIVEPSKRCTIKNCTQIKEIDLFNSEDCTVENCKLLGVGLWLSNARNSTISNASIINGTLSMDWSRDIAFNNLTLINSGISMAGSVPEDFSVSFENSSIDGLPIYSYIDQSDLKLENISAAQIWINNCPGAVIDGVEAEEVYVINSDGVEIMNSEIDGEGINLLFSKNAHLSNNIIAREESGSKTAAIDSASNSTIDR